SISHRALLFSALADGESRIAGLAPGGDVRSTARCLAQVGVPLLRGDGTPWSAPRSATERIAPPERPAGSSALPEHDPDMGPDDAMVRGVGMRGLRAPVADLDCGNSGTTLRLLCGILAGAQVPATLVGDASLSGRPMERVAAPLRQLGARVRTGPSGRPPVVVEPGGAIRAGAIASEVASAQVKSAVLLAGVFAGGEPVGDLSASAQRLRGTELDGDLVLRAIDEVPILAVLGAVAGGTTVIRGAAELRVKESDRLAQMARGLRAMGAQVEELPDGL